MVFYTWKSKRCKHEVSGFSLLLAFRSGLWMAYIDLQTQKALFSQRNLRPFDAFMWTLQRSQHDSGHQIRSVVVSLFSFAKGSKIQISFWDCPGIRPACSWSPFDWWFFAHLASPCTYARLQWPLQHPPDQWRFWQLRQSLLSTALELEVDENKFPRSGLA